jgi:glycosyltransferase involved in cell wall biosynthesis
VNVLLVHQYAIPWRQAGFTRPFDLAKRLVARGHDVTLVSASFSHMERRQIGSGVASGLEVIEGVRFLWLAAPGYGANTGARVVNLLVFMGRVWRGQGVEHAPRPDVIIGSSPSLFAAFGALGLAQRLGVPFVLEIRDIWPESLVELGGYSRANPFIALLDWIEQRLYARAAAILSVLPRGEAYVATRVPTPPKVFWVPNGVDCEEVKVELPPANLEFSVIYAGMHGLANQLDIVIEAARILAGRVDPPFIRFRLVGDGPEKPRLLGRAKSWGLRNVSFEEAVAKHVVSGLLAEADACLVLFGRLPVYQWGISPNKLFDYLAAARPVVLVSDAPIAPYEDAGMEWCVRVAPGDPVALAEALVHLAELPHETRIQMGKRGREYAMLHHGLNPIADRVGQALEWAVTQDRSGA